MKTIKRVTAIFIALMVLVSVFAGCSVKETQSFQSTKAGDIINFGQYEQDGDLSNGKEPIEWRVLAAENGKALLITNKVLNFKPYNNSYNEVTWENCTLRIWLNSDFYISSFSNDQQELIASELLINSNNENTGTVGGNSTVDKIFLLSIDEAKNYFLDDNDRKGGNTAYADSQRPYDNMKDWWLRSPGYDSYKNAYVHTDGNIFYDNIGYDNVMPLGVRPALWINL